jgi:hypothetical protein
MRRIELAGEGSVSGALQCFNYTIQLGTTEGRAK